MRGTAVGDVAERLRSGILTARFAPGQRLIEADLTRDFGISRGPLREAFRRLAAEGLLEMVPNRGAFVRRLTRRETGELFEMRQALECLAARRAADRIDEDGNRAAFEAAIAPIWNDVRRPEGQTYHQENLRFHDAILDICGNSQLANTSRQLRLPLLMWQLNQAMDAEMYQASVLEHRAIATAILAGNGSAAETAMRAHLERASRIADAMPANVFRD